MADVIMPQMGESIAEGTVTKWLKNVGDRVERDEPLFEISTDKVDAEIPSPAAGVLREIRVAPGTTVPIHTVVGVIAAEGEAAARSAQESKQQHECDQRREFLRRARHASLSQRQWRHDETGEYAAERHADLPDRHDEIEDARRRVRHEQMRARRRGRAIGEAEHDRAGCERKHRAAGRRCRQHDDDGYEHAWMTRTAP